MIGARTTRLVRVADLQAFREAVVALACGGSPLDARDRLVVVPTRAAAAHLLRTIEDARLTSSGVVVLPDLITADELVERFASRIEIPRPILIEAEREVLLGVACREARESGAEPPFRLRPGLIAEILRFYDALRLNQKDVDTFERLALGLLEPGASYDRGAERLVRQTRFLASAFRGFERRCTEAGADEHDLRDLLLAASPHRPYRHVMLTVADRAFDPHGLRSADWDLLARIPGLEQIDIVITDRVLAGALHERIHQVLPGIDEVRFTDGVEKPRTPALLVTATGDAVHSDRDREEEIAGFARRVKRAYRRGDVASLDRVALIVHHPLPYVYVTRDILRSAGIPCQTFDAVPLAAEPYAAALDLVFSSVSANFARGPLLALLRSPHFQFADDAAPLSMRDVGALDRILSEAAYLGDADALERLVDGWRAEPPSIGRRAGALRAGRVCLSAVRELASFRERMPMAAHLERLVDFMRAHESLPGINDSRRARHLRARGAILGLLEALRAAYARFDAAAVDFDETAALIRRWIEGHTFAPRAGDTGVHLVDDRSAPFGDFDYVQVAGLVDGEWPDRPRRNIFYSTAILRELGWPSEADRLEGTRAAFGDVLSLPASHLVASTFLLEADSPVSPSPFVDELDRAGLERLQEDAPEAARIFAYEALGRDPVDLSTLEAHARSWAALRIDAPSHDDPRFRGHTSPHAAPAYSLSALERYQDCPFKFFASDVLRLEEDPEDEHALSPRARGRFIHEVFQRFFEAWDRQVGGAIAADTLDEARELFRVVADPLLTRLPESDAALERARLFGSAISVGIVDVVLGLEATRPADVRERWLEYRLEGDFSLGAGGRRIPLKGVADRIDLLSGHRLRVIDYKSGSAPNPRRALQVPIYALCAQERLTERDGTPWAIEDAAYIAFTGKRSLVPVVRAGASDAADALESARIRLFEVVDGVGRGEFPPRPHDPMICRYCAFAGVCRKDYVGDE